MKTNKRISLMISVFFALAVFGGCSSGGTEENTTDTYTNNSGDTGNTTGDSGSTTSGNEGTGSAEVAEVAEESANIPASKYVDGIYTGEGTGKKPGIKISVTIEGDKITDIAVVEYNDSDEHFNDVAAEIIPEIISAQSADVDVISGATMSSEGIIQAVSDALAKAEVK